MDTKETEMNDHEVREIIWRTIRNLKIAGVSDSMIFIETMFAMTCMVLKGFDMDLDKAQTFMSTAVSKDMIEAARDDVLDSETQMEIN